MHKNLPGIQVGIGICARVACMFGREGGRFGCCRAKQFRTIKIIKLKSAFNCSHDSKIQYLSSLCKLSCEHVTLKLIERDLQFLFEIGEVRHINRMWHSFVGADFANLSEHPFRVIWIALVIAKHEGITDTEKVIKMALVHDIPESRTGDVDYLSRQYVERNEDLGLLDMLENTVLADEFVGLWREYEKRDCLEAKVVKDADNLDIDMELREQAANGNSMENVKQKERKAVAETKLYTDTARTMFKAIKQSNPNDWWTTSKRNRLNGGDWKPK